MTSRTALMAAAARAAHLIVDEAPHVFSDPLAVKLLGDQAEELLQYHRVHGGHPVLAGARAQVVCRSRYAEDVLRASGHRQYVVLGAGLDTFAYRADLGGADAADSAGTAAPTVFEVDQPATQESKRASLRKAGIEKRAIYVPVDFERDDLIERLVEHGFDVGQPAVVSWLGVTMYLTREAVEHTVGVLNGLADGSEVVFDHMLPAELRDAAAQAYVDAVGPVNAEHGEPWLTFLSPGDTRQLLAPMTVEHTTQQDVLGTRTDALQPSNVSVITRGTVRKRR
ncbi:SAM-dependent methyltransferase [Dactylosporangium fulvum]|uniref:S-adenosyl-L-methionine-dependent methyltransferase n=1 Tax=Dactylosporangium fulvum TaxID=53359 RepID=A0ABY5VQA4_9ACTN|nr:class I SAM-dependent methyltransferase [Dactylosporangium fulvum]UWP79355.1 class I SAM-dependent methyltransferase [Dactylosporangium fulvum]